MSGPKAAEQLSFKFALRPALARGDFLVVPANEAAVAWIDRWPDWPGFVLAIAGEPGSGKTHLASVWQARSGAETVEGAAVTRETVPLLLGQARPLVVEHADEAPEEPLLHLYNGMVEARRHLLLTACRPPAAWKPGLADLASRLRAVPVASLPPAEDVLLRAVLAKLFNDRQIDVAREVLDYLLNRLERSFDAARQMVERLDERGLARGRPITVALARDVLAELAAENEGKNEGENEGKSESTGENGGGER